MAEKQRPPRPSFEVVFAARLEQAQIQIAELFRNIGEIAFELEQIAEAVRLLTEATRPAPQPSAPPPPPRLLAGRWPLRRGDGYQRTPPQPPTEYEAWVRRSPPATE
jgi:hypothetical protein